MWQHFVEGGWGMWMVLVTGLVALGMGLRYAVVADGRLRPPLEILGRSVLYFSLSGFFTGVVATGGAVFRLRDADPATPIWEVAFIGLKESSTNLALGFTMLALLHLVLAVGARREAAKA
jgi:hypothetical protein